MEHYPITKEIIKGLCSVVFVMAQALNNGLMVQNTVVADPMTIPTAKARFIIQQGILIMGIGLMEKLQGMECIHI